MHAAKFRWAIIALVAAVIAGCNGGEPREQLLPARQASATVEPTLPPLIPTPTPTPFVPRPTALPTPEPTPTAEPFGSSGVTDRIVYVSPDSQIYTIKPDGSDQTRLSPERGPLAAGQFVAGYTWPGWSPDGQSVLFSAALPPGLGSPFALLATAADGSTSERPDVLYENEVGSGTIVPGGPHYALWSPDSKKVASVAATQAGLVVFLSDTEELTTTPLAPGAPVYLGWSPDSKQLLVHVSDRLYRFVEPFNDPPETVDGGNTRYFAPEYAPNDNRAAFMIASESGVALTVQNPYTGDLSPIADVATFGWFRWAPDGESIAVLKGDPRAGDSSIWLAAADGSTEELLATGRYQMMMWSPDGTKILLSELDPSNTERSTWSVLELSSRGIDEIVEFTPSGEIFQLQQFFDQYSASHTFWSPDSESLVFAGLVHEPEPADSDRVRGPDTVWVVDSDGDTPPTAIADGFLAFWSPR